MLHVKLKDALVGSSPEAGKRRSNERTQRSKDLQTIVCNYDNSMLSDYIATILGFYIYSIIAWIIIISVFVEFLFSGALFGPKTENPPKNGIL